MLALAIGCMGCHGPRVSAWKSILPLSRPHPKPRLLLLLRFATGALPKELALDKGIVPGSCGIYHLIKLSAMISSSQAPTVPAPET